MSDLNIREIKQEIEQAGPQIAELISNLDIPLEYKEILMQKAIELVDSPKELAEFTEKLLENYILDQVIEGDEQYQAELKKIDDEIEAEINNILNK